jgi:choline-glycine betaine transporter
MLIQPRLQTGKEELSMVKETSLPRMVYIATGLVIAVAILYTFVFIPRLTTHPQAISEGVDRTSKFFFVIQLVAAAVLLAFVILSRRGGRKFRGLLFLAGILLIFQGLAEFNGAQYYLQTYRGFYAVAILMLVCVGANLIAGILAIIAGNKLRHRPSAK